MIKLPLNSEWTQLNKSDKFGSLAYTKNINLDEAGYIKLSPRTVNIFDDTENVANVADNDFSFPVAFGRDGTGSFYLGTTDEPFRLSLSETAKSISEDESSNNPNMTLASHGIWWQNRWHASTATAVNYLTPSTGTWTANAITGLTSGVRHYMEVFKNRGTILVSNGNTVNQYDTSYSADTTLTLPSDFEVIGMAYNNNKVGIITRLGDNSEGQNAESYFFTWDGATTEAGQGVSVGAYACIAVSAYKSSFVVLTNQGQLLYWNGGGFETLANFPFYNTESRLDDLLNFASYGDIMSVDGDVIYMNVAFDFSQTGRKNEKPVLNNPSGVWCYDPEVGLYHRYSGSLSRMYLHDVTDANINVSTDLFTTSATIPSTGNPMIITQGCSDLDVTRIYYVIKVSPTTFRVAETKEKALAGVYVDITNTTHSYFFICDIRDYGISYYTASGAIATWGNSRRVYRDVLFGNRYDDETQSSVVALNTTVPFLENRGFFVTPKLFLDNTSESIPRLVIKHRALNTDDAIIVKIKDKDFVGLPAKTPTGQGADSLVWTSDNEAYTQFNLSEAKAAIDNGEELELELISGMGAGQMTKITSIAYGSGIYSLVTEDNIVGATAGDKSDFIIDNWKVCASVDVNSQKEGIFDVPIGKNGRAPQFKVELRGYETTIEDILIDNASHIK